jgi:hypothetical protein
MSVSQQFIIYGTYANSMESTSGRTDTDKEVEQEMAKETKAFLTYLDFAALHTR